MIRRPPRSTQGVSSAASDVYKRQRLAVVNRPVLLLDEPTVSLDGFSVKLFAKFLKDEHLAKGGAAVIATHIDLGLDLPELDLTPFKATEADNDGASDEAFL